MENKDIKTLISDLETTIVTALNNINQEKCINLLTLNSKVKKLCNHIQNSNQNIKNNSKSDFKLSLNNLVGSLNEIENRVIKQHILFDTQHSVSPESVAHAYRK